MFLIWDFLTFTRILWTQALLTQRMSMYNWLGLRWAGSLVRGSRKSNFRDREAPSGKYSTCERWLSMRQKITDSIFPAETVHLERMMLAQILRTAFSPQFQAAHKIPSGSWSAARKRLQGALRLCFPDSLTRELLAVPTPLLPHVNNDRFLPLTNPRCWRSDSEVCQMALSRMDWHAPWPKWGCWCVQRIEIEWDKSCVKAWKETQTGFSRPCYKENTDISHTRAGLS